MRGARAIQLGKQEHGRNRHDDPRRRVKDNIALPLCPYRNMIPHRSFELQHQIGDRASLKLDPERFANQDALAVNTADMQEDVLRHEVVKHDPGLADVGQSPVDADRSAIFSQEPVGPIEIRDFLL